MNKRKYIRFKWLFIMVALVMVGISVCAKANEKENRCFTQSVETCIDVPLICQYPTLPTGCESTAAAMVLQFYGQDISAEQFAEEWLECQSSFYYENDIHYGPDPEEVFAGNPFTKNSYGCFAPVIKNAVNNNSKVCKAETITGETLETLCADYIDNGKPLLIWATMGMKAAATGNAWVLEDGSIYTWIAGEHCLVLVGYNEDCYYLNDPMSGSVVCFEKEVVQKRFEELGSQAVYICQNE